MAAMSHEQRVDIAFEAARERMREGTWSMEPNRKKLSDGVDLRAAIEASVRALDDAGAFRG